MKRPDIQIVTITRADPELRLTAANLLVEGFREHWPAAWPDIHAALKEIDEALEPGTICRGALDTTGQLVGWIGGRSAYGGNVWELHPLVVSPTRQGEGIGRALVTDLEAQVAARGGLTIFLGTDDEDFQTSLSNCNLYLDLPGQIAAVRNLRRHPYEFYQRCGFVIVGVVPDANGVGKPDILMAKRVVRVSVDSMVI